MGGLKPYFAEVRTITVSKEYNLLIRVTPAYNQNELPYFEAVTPVGLWLSEEPCKSAYFHFKDSKMEFFRSYYPQWRVTDRDVERIRETLLKDHGDYSGHTNWQMACYWWNVEHGIIDFNAPKELYFQGVFDEFHKRNRSYIPHDQKMPETWVYAPPHRIRKCLIID